MLVAEGVGTHFGRKYIYFAMAFSLIVELLNLRNAIQEAGGRHAARQSRPSA
jgi:hypothetical protein